VPGDGNDAQDVFVRDRRSGTTVRVSVASDGSEGNGVSGGASISSDGRLVAFWSEASNLVANDSNGSADVFVRDRARGTTTRVSVSTGGTQANGPSRSAALSGDGRALAFRSNASNLVGGDTNGTWDIFVHDLLSAETTRVSVSSRGTQSNGRSRDPALNGDGHIVAFRSEATNLVGNDRNGAGDIFVHDRRSGATYRVNVGPRGAEAKGCGVTECGCDPVLSKNGHVVAFWSSARNLVRGDTNMAWDVFVHDNRTGRTTRVSVGPHGRQGQGLSGEPWLSANGRFVVFSSKARLTTGDANAEWDVFVHDRTTGGTTAVTPPGIQGNGLSTDPVLSANGRYLAFYSFSSNFVAADTNRAADIFVRRR
jgi:Tol biopolymer transport system component